MERKLLLVGALLLLFCTGAYSQDTSMHTLLLKLKATSDSTNEHYAPEKLYLQFDKPYYAAGDTIWLKAWLINGSTYLLSAKSGLLHIDIANDSNKVIKQYLLPVQAGVSWGNIALDEKDFKTGTFILRAYTNWMRNFGEDCFFYKQFYVSSAGENNWLIDARFNTSIVNGSNTLNAGLLFSDMNKIPFAVQLLQLRVMNGSRQLYKQKVQTGVDGVLDVNIKLPQKTAGLAIIAESEQKDKRAVIPVMLNRPENTDLQFMPEGGSLVAGINTRIGFKAISEDGKGAEVSGIITDQNQKQAATFKSLHNGMGSFDLLAGNGKTYTATVILPGGLTKTYPLPQVKASGTVLKVDNKAAGDSVAISFSATDDLVQLHESYFLIGKARGVICYAAIISFNNNKIKKLIAKNLFPSGIAHFVITTAKGQPLHERLVYIDHHDNLHINIEPHQDTYEPKDSVALHIKVTDSEGRPVAGNFSLAVTDDAQVKADTLNRDNILTGLLLTSDLKGYVEQPGYYLKAQNAAALDNLLLTQGWISYAPAAPKQLYAAETEFKVSGNVVNVFSKPVKNSKVTLFSKSPFIATDMLTDKEGKFIFHNIPRADTPIFILNALNKNGKSFNVSINIDEVPAPAFNAAKTPILIPWYVNSDPTLMNYVKNNKVFKNQMGGLFVGQNVLTEIVIKAKKFIKGSQNLNGPGNADQVIDEEELEKAGKKTFLDLLQERVKGFKEGFFVVSSGGMRGEKDRTLSGFVTDGDPLKTDQPWYFINDKPVKFIIDGTPIYKVFPLLNRYYVFDDISNYLKSHSAEDIKGIEVNATSKYSSRYIPIDSAWKINAADVSFIEITTRSGHGPVITNTPGMYLYKPLAISWPKQFYKPKYKMTDTAKRPLDLRSTIHWEPNVITDENGKASVSFYTASSPSTYTILAEGIDFNGNLGVKSQKMIIRKHDNNSK